MGARDELYRVLLAAADVLSAAAALSFAVTAIGSDMLEPVTFAAAPLVAVVGKLVGLYDRDQHVLRKATLDEAPALFRVATLFTLVFWLGEDLFVRGYLGHDQVFAIWALLFLFMLGGRVAARRLARLAGGRERCLVLGSEAAALAIEKRLVESPAVNAAVLGRLPLGQVEWLDHAVGGGAIDRVIIFPEGQDDETLEAIRRVQLRGLKVSVVPRLFEVVGSSVEFDAIDGVTVLGIRKYGLGRSSEALKRVTDVAGAAIALLLVTPFALAAALATRRAGTPLLVRERRAGRGGTEFDMLRFETGESAAGRRLRRSSLDKLPRLVNVLRGEMSLVGPRPPLRDGQQGTDSSHLSLAPGITGLWHIAEPARLAPEELVKIEYLYGANWSLWLDARILLRTVPRALTRVWQ